MNLLNAFKHSKKILTHKRWVAHYCFMCGLYRQGLMHDLSKFSPTEFFESVKYYQGTSSPIDACKKDKGYSDAWFHHRGRNKHHWEYWVDDFQEGMHPKKMPFKYVLEMVCDFLGAGRAYGEEQFSIRSEYDWWQAKRKVVVMHSDTLELVDSFFNYMLKYGIESVLRSSATIRLLKEFYNREE